MTTQQFAQSMLLCTYPYYQEVLHKVLHEPSQAQPKPAILPSSIYYFI